MCEPLLVSIARSMVSLVLDRSHLIELALLLALHLTPVTVPALLFQEFDHATPFPLLQKLSPNTLNLLMGLGEPFLAATPLSADAAQKIVEDCQLPSRLPLRLVLGQLMLPPLSEGVQALRSEERRV